MNSYMLPHGARAVDSPRRTMQADSSAMPMYTIPSPARPSR